MLLNSKVTDGCVWRWVRLCVVSGWHWPPPPKSGLTEKVTEQRWLFSANDSMTTQFHAGCHRVPGILHTENILSRYNVNHSANVPQLLVAHCCVKVPRTAPYRRGGGVVLISHDTVDGNAIKSAAISGGFRGGRAGSAHPPPSATNRRCHSRYVTTVLYYNDTIASLSLQTHQTWFSEYSKWSPPGRGFLTALECIKFVFGRDPSQTPLGELTALLQTTYGSWFKGAYF